MDDEIDLNTEKIKEWRSIVTLVVFVITNIIVLFPFHVPVFVPRVLWDGFVDSLRALRIIPPRRHHGDGSKGRAQKRFVRFNFPFNFVTAPLIADLFLLAILAINGTEVREGTLGANNISPIDIMAFFITLAYIAISIDASGLIRYMAFKVLQWGGKVGHRLFFYLYVFFFGLGTMIGNDPIILSGTAFLAYMTRVSSNIVHPRAWIHTQFAVANIASAILVSSNPTNLVLAGAFQIKFIVYTANMVVPVVLTAIVLFPFLLYIIFADESLIPVSIEMHELPESARGRAPVNPNIPHARGADEEIEEESPTGETGKLLSLEEIMNPFLDKGGAWFGGIIMAVTLITLLALNASTQSHSGLQVYWVTVPAAFVMFCWDLGFGWWHRHDTREIARKGRRDFAEAQAERAKRREQKAASGDPASGAVLTAEQPSLTQEYTPETELRKRNPASDGESITKEGSEKQESESSCPPEGRVDALDEKKQAGAVEEGSPSKPAREKATLVSITRDAWIWSQDTFPTATAVLAHLPFALIPFAFTMFILVQALVTKGWVPVFAYGWDHWVHKTGTIGAIGGMGFLSVILCNFAGTNIGTTILLCRVIQSWVEIRRQAGDHISDRTFWGTVYSMALGVNYGAFSTAFSASLAGLLWRDILRRKHIRVRGLEFARVNLPIIAISMIVGCAVLIGEIYIKRTEEPFSLT